MPDTANPSPRRKGRAAIAVVAAVLFIAVAIFAGMNFQYVQDDTDAPPPATTPSN